MLQRAASNAYSWWWASHIRTKQSKWLEQCLQDMDERVQSMLKLIEGDGDSFAKRAEMYYKRRPELVSSVEEAYKQFRALADRYDIMSKELQNANHTIATVFPEQVQFAMSEEGDGTAKFPQNPAGDAGKVPQVPKEPIQELKKIISKASKQHQEKKLLKAQNPKVVSGLSKEEALEEISKLQKEILALQTVKEFVKSSYESGVAKYWGIENQIMEMQQKVSRLQDEFDLDSVIEDDDARTLMAEAALKSCQETLALLEQKQEISIRDAREEYKRIEIAYQRLQSLREKYVMALGDDEAKKVGDESRKLSSKDFDDFIKETDIETLPEKSEDSLELGSLSSLTVSQLADKIDQLVNKVITLETAVSSQTVLVNTLRSETDDLNAQIRDLEEENANLVDESQNLTSRVKEVEEKLTKVQDLNKSVETRNSHLQTNFAQARTNLDHLSEKLSSVKADEEPETPQTNVDRLPVKSVQELVSPANPDHVSEQQSNEKACDKQEVTESSIREVMSTSVEETKDVESLDENDRHLSASKTEDIKDVKEVDVDVKASSDPSLDKQDDVKKEIRRTDTFLERKVKEHAAKDQADDAEAHGKTEEHEELNWQQILLNGMEDGEKILLKEYTTILRNYKDVKKKLNETEKKERESQFDTMVQMRELKKSIQKRDEEIKRLRRRLSSVDGNVEDVKEESTLSSLLVSDASGEFGQTPITYEDSDKLIFVDRCPSTSRVEEKLRSDIDAILDENLDFWLRFSTAFHQVQKFKTEVKDLQDEITKIKEKRKPNPEMKSEVVPIYKHLREIQRELAVWLEKSTPLKDELKSRFASLCNIQEEITSALREGVEEDEIRFSSHQAAKLQGEILNMKQENNKVREELQAGLDHANILQLQIEKMLTKLNDEFGISNDQSDHSNRNKVPLRSFIFGSKPKKQKNSLFSIMHPNKRYQLLRAGIRLSTRPSS